MDSVPSALSFEAPLRRPADPGPGEAWCFVLLPAEVSAELPRRGRLTVEGTINGRRFRKTLEPDGQGSHWLRIGPDLVGPGESGAGQGVKLALAAVVPEPDPTPPADLAAALSVDPAAQAVWAETSSLARVDWIHWVESAKQNRTRETRVRTACSMLAGGKRRVCCFDPSGVYSRAFTAPKEAAPGDAAVFRGG